MWVIRLGEFMKNSPVAAHRHVADRLAVLLDLAEVHWVDGELRDEHMAVSGELTVFTESLIAIVTLIGEVRSHDGHRLGQKDAGTTNVLVVPRKSLRAVRLTSAQDDRWRNSSYTWARWTQDGRPNTEGWPAASAPVELQYGEHTVTVNSQIGGGREGFDTFMASVMSDLAE